MTGTQFRRRLRATVAEVVRAAFLAELGVGSRRGSEAAGLSCAECGKRLPTAQRLGAHRFTAHRVRSEGRAA